MKIRLLIWIVGFSLPLLGQQYNFRTYSDREIAANYIYDFLQDQNGYLYLATSEGLYVYDGIHFNRYTSKNGLRDDFVNGLFWGNDSSVWFTYYQGGCGYIDGKSILNIPKDALISDIVCGPEHNTYFFSEHGNLVFDGKNLRNVDAQFNPDTKKATLWNGQWITLDNAQNLKLYRDDTVKSIANDIIDFHHSESTFIAYTNRQLLELTVEPTGIKCKTLTNFDELGLGDEIIRNVQVFSDQIFISTQSKGVLVYSVTKQGNTLELIETYNQFSGTPSNDIQTTFVDRQDNTWFGTYGGQLFMLPHEKIARYLTSNNNSGHSINTFETFKNIRYVGSNNGLSTPSNTSFKGLQGKRISALKKFQSVLFIGTSKHGVFQLEQGEIKPLQRDIDKYINCFTQANKHLYIGTNSGLYILNETFEQVEHLTTNDGLAHNIITDIHRDRSNTLWIISPNSPVYCLRNDQWNYFRDITDFESYNATCILETNDGKMLFGTQGDGILVFENGLFSHRITIENGLYSNHIYFLEQGTDETLIIGHAGGISFKQKGDPSFRNTGYREEFKYVNYNASEFDQNTLFIGTPNGYLGVPNLTSFTRHVLPDLKINAIYINEVQRQIDQPITLKNGNYYVEFDFQAVSLAHPEEVSYRYKLHGFDKKWTAAAFDETNAYYQSLSSGKYLFEVQLVYRGQVTDQISKLEITIKRPFWQNAGFLIAAFLSLILIFLAILYGINKYNKKLRQKLHKKVVERTHTIRKKNEEITLINKDLTSLSRQYRIEKEKAEDQKDELVKSIAYAHRIQKIFVRKREYADWLNYFQDSFLLFKPKDLVSGDFYWASLKNERLFICVGDCTGHGVPGAMISILGITLLNEIIPFHQHTDKILNELRSRIIQELNQSKQNEMVMDGMDGALIAVDLKTHQIEYSGGFSPLYIMRSKKTNLTHDPSLNIVAETEDMVMLSIQPDRQPIGYYYKMQPFQKSIIQGEKGDFLILMSDGYADQFGGQHGKKFKRKNIYNLLLNNAHLSGEQLQHLLWNTMVDWKGDKEQVDDIAIGGFKI